MTNQLLLVSDPKKGAVAGGALAGGVDDVLAGRPAHHHESILISWSLVLSGVADVIQGGA